MQTVVIIDHNDSFTDNLARYFRLCNVSTEIIRFDMIPKHIDASHLVFSPGPKAPSDYPESMRLLKTNIGKSAILGVCLGHQILGQAFGYQIKRSQKLQHGQSCVLSNCSGQIFKGINKPVVVGCYNSLVLSDTMDQKSPLEVAAVNDFGEIMALQHTSLQIYGVQFHPESVLTEQGLVMINNFLGN